MHSVIDSNSKPMCSATSCPGLSIPAWKVSMNKTIIAPLLTLAAILALPATTVAQKQERKSTHKQNQRQPFQRKSTFGGGSVVLEATLSGTSASDNTVTYYVNPNDKKTLVCSSDAKVFIGTSTYGIDNELYDGLYCLTKYCSKKTIHIEAVTSGNSTKIERVWDERAFRIFLNQHKAVKSGQITSKHGNVLRLGDLRYEINGSTTFVADGTAVSLQSFNIGDTVHVKGDTSSGSPVAVTVGKTEADARGGNAKSMSERLDGAEKRTSRRAVEKLKQGKRTSGGGR